LVGGAGVLIASCVTPIWIPATVIVPDRELVPAFAGTE
jgi:hypothetical protein